MIGGLVLREHREGQKLAVRASGLLTVRAILYAQAFIATHLRRQPATVVILDLTGCVHMLMDTHLDDLARESAGGPNRVAIPMVLVVPPLFEAICERYCEKAARHGLLRMCYLSSSEASAWASSVEEDWPVFVAAWRRSFRCWSMARRATVPHALRSSSGCLSISSATAVA
jgi:hypothetical protein